MAYKRGTIIKDNNDVKEITKGLLSNATLGIKEDPSEQPKEVEQPKAKREYKPRYTIQNKKEEKSINVNIRLTQSEFNELMTKVEKSGLGTTSNYIRALIKKGL